MAAPRINRKNAHRITARANASLKSDALRSNGGGGSPVRDAEPPRRQQVAAKPTATDAATAREAATPSMLATDHRPAWGVLVYLAGDTEWGSNALRSDLEEILKTGSSDELAIFVQHDGPDGATRYIVPPHPSPGLAPVQRLGRVDSGR